MFAYHASSRSVPGTAHDLAMSIAGRGYVGVSFFFMLSGFVLTWSRRDADRPRDFYRRRFARIAPVYWVCLAIALVVRVAGTLDPVGETVRALPSVLALQAWIPVSDVYYGGNSPGWSISAEAFFYLVFPAVALALATRRHRLLLVIGALVLALGPALVLRPEGSSSADAAYWAIYIFPVTRLADFVVGMLLAQAMLSGWRPPIGLPTAGVLTVAVYVLSGFTPPWSTVTVVTLVPFALLIAAAAQSDLDGRSRRLTGANAVRLGQWSFAFYLIHVPALTVQHEVSVRLGASALLDAILILLCLGGCVVLAAVLHLRVEEPWERRLRRAPARLD